MSNIVDVLRADYPQAEPLRDYVVEDRLDGRGQRIVAWSAALGPKPDEQALAARWTEAVATQARQIAADREIDGLDALKALALVCRQRDNAIRTALAPLGVTLPTWTIDEWRAALRQAYRTVRGL